MMRETLSAAAPEGVKTPLIAHLELVASDAGQLLLGAKSPLLVPLMVRLLMLTAEVLLLNGVTDRAGSVVRSFWLPNATPPGDRDAPGPESSSDPDKDRVQIVPRSGYP